MLAGDYKLALTDFNHVLEMAPQQEDGLREPRQSALRHKPDDFDLLGFRGHARQHTGDLQGSLADLDKALGIRQDNARAHALRGETREKLGDLKSAFADLTQALKIQPSFPEASAAMVRVQHALGQ
jgi:tetratricopeptide (TPR) repeat protein